MFADNHTDFGGPPRLKASSAQTKIKKAGKSSKDEVVRNMTTQQIDAVESPPPPPRPVKVVHKPANAKAVISPPSPLPPPSRPFKVIPKPTKAHKATPQEVIEISSSPDSQEILVEDSDTEYEDDSHAKKRKRKAGSSSRALKQRTPSDNGFEPKEKKGKPDKGKQPMRTLDASTLKGGSLSPSTVESSSDKQHSINKG
jgi:hypothetical protein